jgi:hypothetical protein
MDMLGDAVTECDQMAAPASTIMQAGIISKLKRIDHLSKSTT